MENTNIHQTSASGIGRDRFIFHKVSAVKPLEDFRLMVTFECGDVKEYDVKPLFTKWPSFCALRDEQKLFELVDVSPGGYGVIWNDELDLSCEELWNG